MNRRDALKYGAICACALATSACDVHSHTKSDENIKAASNTQKIIHPKQKEKYNFSMPMPFDYKIINEIAQINKKNKKVKITTLYNSVPSPLAAALTNFQSPRGFNTEIKSFSQFAKYVKYAKQLGFEFVYTLNAPKPFDEYEFNFKKADLYKLLDNLAKIDAKILKVGNTQLLTLLYESFPDFSFQCSTTFEYSNINQYINLFQLYPNINTVNISTDLNKNFKFIENFRKIFPDKKLEVMVNEATCLRGCPSRTAHNSTRFCQFNCALVKIKSEINFSLN